MAAAHRETSAHADGTFHAQLFTFQPDDAKKLADTSANRIAEKVGPHTARIRVNSADEASCEIAA